MSALLFRGNKKGTTVVTWESLSEQEKYSWLKEASTMHDWVVRCTSKKGAEEIRSFYSSAGKRSFVIMMKRNRIRRRTKRKGAKRKHRAYNSGHGGSKAKSKWQ